jgi:uncharacterized protein YjdB
MKSGADEWENISGATSRIYVTERLKMSDNGNRYRCAVNDEDHLLHSTPASIGVLQMLPSASEIAANVTTVTAIREGQTQLALPGVPEDDYTIALKSSSDPSVIDLDGVITPSYNERVVDLVFEITRELDGTKAVTAPIRVVVPRAPSDLPGTAEEAAALLPAQIMLTPDATEFLTPEIPGGDFEVFIYSTSPAGVISEDGSVVPPVRDTNVNVVFLIVDMRSNTVTYSAPVKVTVKGRTLFALEGVTLSPGHLSLDEGDKGQFKVSFFPANTTDPKKVSYSVAPQGVVSVTAGGGYTALKSGGAVVTATSADGKHKAFCTVVVAAKVDEEDQLTAPGDLVQSLSVTPKSVKLAFGGTVKPAASVAPATAAQGNPVTWTSSDSKVAAVASDGTVSGVGEGTAKITATAGGKSASCDVTVMKPVTKLYTALSQVSLKVKSKVTLPVAAYDKDGAVTALLKWTSGKPAVAAVDAKTGKITAKKTGTAKITATALNGKKLTVTVKVVKKAKAVGKITLVKPPKTIKKGKTVRLKVKITPAGAAYKTVVFRSSKPGVVSVDKAGTLTAKKKGKAVITVKAGSKFITKAITVK